MVYNFVSYKLESHEIVSRIYTPTTMQTFALQQTLQFFFEINLDLYRVSVTFACYLIPKL